MRITFFKSENVYVHFNFGFKTPIWHCIYWFCRTTEYFNEIGEVEFATMDWCFFKQPKYWFK